MDNFDYKKYLREGRINKDFSQLDEKKEDSKKGNKEEQKRMEGAIRDNRDHVKSLEKDIKADQKKLKKLNKILDLMWKVERMSYSRSFLDQAIYYIELLIHVIEDDRE